MLIQTGGKKFEKPSPGIWLGRVIDVEELGLVPSKGNFAPQVRTRIVWVVAPVPGQGLPNVDSEGRAFRHMEQPPSKMTPPTKYQASKMYKLAEQIFGGVDKIPVPFDDEFFMDRTNQLILTTNGPMGEFRNIVAAMPVPAAMMSLVPPVPTGFVRAKDRPKQPGQAQATPAVASPATVVVAAPVQEIDDSDILF
jgi:hypothetical protein